MRRAEEQGGPGTQPPGPPCELCDGTGWLTFEDPILGGEVDARCPDCEDTHADRAVQPHPLGNTPSTS